MRLRPPRQRNDYEITSLCFHSRGAESSDLLVASADAKSIKAREGARRGLGWGGGSDQGLLSQTRLMGLAYTDQARGGARGVNGAAYWQSHRVSGRSGYKIYKPSQFTGSKAFMISQICESTKWLTPPSLPSNERLLIKHECRHV